MSSHIVITDHPVSKVGSIRNIALSKSYGQIEHDGDVYNGMAKCDPELACEITETFGHAEAIVQQAFFRMEIDGDMPTHWIHEDSSISQWAMILYLCDGPGGTAIWRHASTKRYCIPENIDDLPFDVQVDYKQIFQHDSSDRGAWEMTAFAGVKLGRSLVFPSRLFHSRFPIESFGNTKENGRLIFVSFFNLP